MLAQKNTLTLCSQQTGSVSSSHHPFHETENIRWLSISSFGTETKNPSELLWCWFHGPDHAHFHGDRFVSGWTVDLFLEYIQGLNSSWETDWIPKYQWTLMEPQTCLWNPQNSFLVLLCGCQGHSFKIFSVVTGNVKMSQSHWHTHTHKHLLLQHKFLMRLAVASSVFCLFFESMKIKTWAVTSARRKLIWKPDEERWCCPFVNV